MAFTSLAGISYFLFNSIKPTKVINNTHIYEATSKEVKEANRNNTIKDNKADFKYATLPIDLKIYNFTDHIEIEDFHCTPRNPGITTCYYSFDGQGQKSNSLTLRLKKGRVIFYDLHLMGKRPVSYLVHQLSKYKEARQVLGQEKTAISSFKYGGKDIQLTLSYFRKESRYHSIQLSIE